MKRQPITNDGIAMSRKWCIAGGFAACPALASDIDVWVFLTPIERYQDDHDRVRDNMLWNLRVQHIDYERQENNLSTQAGIELYDLGNGILNWKVAKLADGRHIMLTNATDEQHLLDNFDVSTHQVALTSDGELIKGSGFTPITEPPVALRNGVMTESRMRKIERRYRQFRYPQDDSNLWGV